MKIAAAYVRVSTERQDEYSLDSQLRLIRDYASSHDMHVPREFVFVEDGVSGRSVKGRPAFQEMVALAKEKDRPFDVILVWKFSRFARNQEESILYKSMLARSGVDVVSISETMDDSPFASLIERIIEWMDEFYSIRLSGEVKRGMAERLSRAEIVTIPSFGYDVQGKTYVPNDKAPLVRGIFADYLSGKGIRTIAQELNAAGIKTRRGSAPSNRWVRYILRNPVYIGKIRWSTNGKVAYINDEKADHAILVDGGFEPLVDEATFNAVQERLDRRAAALPYTRHDQPTEHCLKGLLRCSSCGSTLVAASGFYQCHKYAHGLCSVSHCLSFRKAETSLISALENCVATGSFPLAPQLLEARPIGPDYPRLIAAEEQKLRRVHDAYEAGIDTLDEYAKKKAKILAAIEDLRSRQSALEQPRPCSVDSAAMRERVSSVLALMHDTSATPKAKNDALRSVLSHVVYDKPSSTLVLYFLA